MRIITFGELLYRFSPPSRLRFGQSNQFETFVGGAEANTSISLAQFGNTVEYVTAVPNNELGQYALRELRGWGVDTSRCKLQGERMGLYFVENGTSLRGGKLIYDRAHSSFSQIDASTFDWDEILEGADLFHWSGITPALSVGAADATRKALETAKKLGIPVSCDLNYRSKLWKYGTDAKDVMPELMSYCHYVLANEKDVESYLGISPSEADYEVIEGFDERAYKFISTELIKAFPEMKMVISTLRQTINASANRWASAIYDGSGYKHSNAIEINNIFDRVGGGDSFMAAFLHGLLNFNDHQKMLDFATTASAIKLSIKGDYNILSEDEVLDSMSASITGQINR